MRMARWMTLREHYLRGNGTGLRLSAGALSIGPGRQVAANASGDNVDSPFLRNRLGHLAAEMQVQHLGTSGNNYVHLIFTWS